MALNELTDAIDSQESDVRAWLADLRQIDKPRCAWRRIMADLQQDIALPQAQFFRMTQGQL